MTDVVAYRRGLVVALFVVSVAAGVWLVIQTFLLGLENWGSYGDLQTFGEVPLYWVNIAVLALLALGIAWNVRAEYRDGHPFVAGTVLAALSLVPLLYGLWQLVVVR